VRLRRLGEGRSEIRRVRVACALVGKPNALVFQAQEGDRLAVVPEGDGAAPRTLTAPPQPLADLVARQLSDRERDPVFHDSMAVAQMFARSILG
jgi:hypothetical protein